MSVEREIVAVQQEGQAPVGSRDTKVVRECDFKKFFTPKKKDVGWLVTEFWLEYTVMANSPVA